MFSCFARGLKKVSARSVPELEASITKSFSGVKVVWLRSVVNYWAVRADRWNKKITLMGSYSFELTLRGGRPVMRTKDEMSQEEWLPLGGVKYATPMLTPRVPSATPTAFSFVIAAVHPVDSLRSHIESDEARLRLVRSAVSFPHEVAGVAWAWWQEFLAAEQARAEAMCSSCRDIWVELATIRQQKSKSLEVKAENKAKFSRRTELLEQLEKHAHRCNVYASHGEEVGFAKGIQDMRGSHHEGHGGCCAVCSGRGRAHGRAAVLVGQGYAPVSAPHHTLVLWRQVPGTLLSSFEQEKIQAA